MRLCSQESRLTERQQTAVTLHSLSFDNLLPALVQLILARNRGIELARLAPSACPCLNLNKEIQAAFPTPRGLQAKIIQRLSESIHQCRKMCAFVGVIGSINGESNSGSSLRLKSAPIHAMLRSVTGACDSAARGSVNVACA